MNKSELIKKYEKELESLNIEVKHNQERNFQQGVDFNKGERIQVRQFIEELKNLNEETVKRSEVCGNCGSDNTIILLNGCNDCGFEFSSKSSEA